MTTTVAAGTVSRLADVARLAGVSVSTASRALAGQPSVPAARARQIRAVADELGYVPDQAARALRMGIAPTIAVILPDLGRHDCGSFLRGVAEAAEEHDLGVILASCQAHTEQTAATIARLRAQRPDVIVVVHGPATSQPDPVLDAALADYQAEGGRVSTVTRSSAVTAAQGRAVVALALTRQHHDTRGSLSERRSPRSGRP